MNQPEPTDADREAAFRYALSSSGIGCPVSWRDAARLAFLAGIRYAREHAARAAEGIGDDDIAAAIRRGAPTHEED